MFGRKSKAQKLMEQIIATRPAYKVFLWYADYDGRFFASVSWRCGDDDDVPDIETSGDSPENALERLIEKIAVLDEIEQRQKR